MEMDQETAKTLLVEGGTFVFLGVPEETQFGIDMQCWNTEEDFRGIKMIPPGLHYIHYSAVSRSTGDVSPRSGFMHFFKKQEFLVRMWDKKKEDVSPDEITEESLQRLKDNLLNLDRYLAPYPYEHWHKWKMLTSEINADLASNLSPESGIIRSATELLSCSDKDRPRGIKKSKSDLNIANQEQKPDDTLNKSESMVVPSESTEDLSVKKSNAELAGFNSNVAMPSCSTDNVSMAGSTESLSDSGPDVTKPKLRFASFEDKEAALLPNLKPAPGTALRFTEIPRDKYPPGSTPREITKHCLDQSYTLELVMARHPEPMDIIGELQYAYLCFLIGHSLDAFEHWKNLVVLLCSCEDALHKHRNVFFNFIRTLEIQIDEMPDGFLADIVMNKNLVYKKLRELFRTAYTSNVEARLLCCMDRFKQSLTEKLMWDFTGLDSEDEEERPVVVDLGE